MGKCEISRLFKMDSLASLLLIFTAALPLRITVLHTCIHLYSSKTDSCLYFPNIQCMDTYPCYQFDK